MLVVPVKVVLVMAEVMAVLVVMVVVSEDNGGGGDVPEGGKGGRAQRLETNFPRIIISKRGGDFPGGPEVKDLLANPGDTGSSPVQEDSTCRRATEPVRLGACAPARAAAAGTASHNWRGAPAHRS